MLATVLLLTTLPIVVGGGLVAGNLMLDLNARNDILYEQLRQSLSIDILEDVFSNNEKVPPPLTMHTADGERYVCSLPDLDGFDENDDDTASSSNDAASATAVHPAERMESIMKTLEGRCDTLNVGWWSYEWCHRRHVRQFHVDHASGKVDPVWSLGHYTRTDLKISATTDSASSSGDASSDPPAYPPTPPQPAASVVTSVVDLFEAGGQHCDEIGKGRQTRIEFRCCTDASSPVDASPAPSSSRSLVAAAAAAAAMAAAVDPNDNSRTAQRKRKNAALTAAAAAAAAAAAGTTAAASSAAGGRASSSATSALAVATFTDIHEPEVCGYVAVVCTPLMCDDHGGDDDDGNKARDNGSGGNGVVSGAGGVTRGGGGKGASGGGVGGKSVFALLEPLSAVCLSRHEGWWSYEVCYGRHARQFHVVQAVDEHGKATSSVEGEFVLGEADQSLLQALERQKKLHANDGSSSGGGSGDSTALDEAAYIVPAPLGTADHANAPSTLEIEYIDGTPCDLTGTPRSTTISFSCGKADAIMSVVEDRTCHYRVSVVTTHLCRHPSFVHRRPATRTVSCELKQDDEENGDDENGEGGEEENRSGVPD